MKMPNLPDVTDGPATPNGGRLQQDGSADVGIMWTPRAKWVLCRAIKLASEKPDKLVTPNSIQRALNELPPHSGYPPNAKLTQAD